MRASHLFTLALLIGLLACVCAPLCSAQEQAAAGVVPAFTSLETHEYDTINLATLAIRLNVPVRIKAGPIPFDYRLQGDVQVVGHVTENGRSFTTYIFAAPSLGGGEVHLGGSIAHTSQTAKVYCGGVYYNDYGGWVYTDQSGASHSTSIGFLLQGAPSSCGPTSGSSWTTDGSGIFVYISTGGGIGGYAIDSRGNKVPFDPGSHGFTDANGNSIAGTYAGGTATLTDTLNEIALTSTISTSNPPANPYEIDSWTDAAGNAQSVKYYRNSLTANTTFGCADWPANSPATSYFPGSVVLPDGSSVSYTWEQVYNNSSQYTGRLASITLPTGGKITYSYSGGTNGVNCQDATPATMTRATSDGTWTYTHVPSSGAGVNFQGPGTTTVVDPLGNKTVYTFEAFGIPSSSWTTDPLETERQIYDSHNNLLQTVTTCYNDLNSTATSCNPSPGSLPITEKDVYTAYPGTGYAALKTAYDTYGRVTDVKSFDFSGAQINEKQITYGSGNPTAQSCQAISAYIIAKPCTVTLLDSQNDNAVLSQVWNAYDPNGNLLQTWDLVTGSGASGVYLSKQYTYDSHGVVQTVTDVNGQVTNYSTTSCNNQFVTSEFPSNYPNLATSQTWDCNGGAVTSQTDANGQTAYTNFAVGGSADPFYRPLQSVDELGNTTTFTYTPNSTESVLPVNGGASVIDTLSTTDSIGRPVVSQLRQGPGSTSWDTKSRTFDGDGRVYEATLPCVTSHGAACGTVADTQTYDALNRPLVHTGAGGDVVTKTYYANDGLTTLSPAPSGEHTKSIQKEYDGLGRLTSECVISSAPGSGPCGQANGGTGFLTKYTYDGAGRLLKVVENAQGSAQQTRSYTYDLTGRVLSETNPESGTTSYTYDSVSGTNCSSTSPGDLVQELDQNGNTTCYHYDGLHRKTYITYSGPNSNGISKYFVYDSATVDGSTMAYAEGHLAEAYTCAGSNPAPCSPKITDEGFSYDQRGQLSEYYQLSPNSGGYYILSATHWEDGQLKAVSGLGLPTLTYGSLDGEARVTAVTSSSGANPVSGVAYNASNNNEPVGALLSVTLGTGDSQNFTYDPDTGRMVSYAASVGTGPAVISGDLTWNANGTLQQLNISDAYNNADTQNCTYQYDDFIRATSVNCVNGPTNTWNQNFTYGSDAFGNLCKTVPPGGVGDSWPPACSDYNSATNQYAGVSGVSYDADGDLMSDTFHTYTWLADGHVASVSTGGSITTSITYDAEGNKVEENGGTGGSLYEYVSAFGISAQMSGQTEVSADVDLPGGVQALYANGSLVRFRYPDWQGSIRAESSVSSRVFTESVAFAPFGERYAQAGAPFNVDSFTGKPDQIASDEYDFPAREMHDGQGRWISPDPLRGTGNKYVYADNNPLSNVDLGGLLTIQIFDPLEGTYGETIDFVPRKDEDQSESYQLISRQAAQEINFLCGALDCTAPGTSNMLLGMGLIAPPQTETAAGQQQAQAAQSQQQGQPAQQAQAQSAAVPQDVKDAIQASLNASNAPSGADKTGGFHEESGVAGTDVNGKSVISPDKPGPYANPDNTNEAHTSGQPVDQNVRNSIANVTVGWHIHPSGRTATHEWNQPPSAADRRAAIPGAINIVVGARNKTVYFYGASGPVVHIKLRDFMGGP